MAVAIGKRHRSGIGAATRIARTQAGFTLRELAKMTEIELSVLSRTETGQRDLELHEAALIAASCGVTVNALIPDAITPPRG